MFSRCRTRDSVGQQKSSTSSTSLTSFYWTKLTAKLLLYVGTTATIRIAGCCQVGAVLALCRCQVEGTESADFSVYVLFDFFWLLHFLQHITQFALICPMLLSFLSIVANVLYCMYCNST